MFPFRWVTIPVVAVMMLITGTARADTLQLANGDRLTGAITSAADGFVVFESTVAGTVQVAIGDIACMVSDGELTLFTENGAMFTGRMECPDEGWIRLVPASEDAAGAGQAVRELEIRNIRGMKLPSPDKKIVHNGNISAGGFQAHGNKSSTAWNASARLVSRYEKHRLGLEGKYNYGKSGDEVTAADHLAGAKYDYFLTKRLFSYIQGLYERDRVANLDRRLTSGAGLGYQLIDTPRHQLSVEAGIAHVNEHNDDAANRDYEAARWAARLDSELVADKLIFFHSHEGYDRLDDSDTFLFRSDQGLRLKVANNFYTTFEVDYDYNDNPPADQKKSDSKYIFGLSYDFSL
ncbi:MAG: DUF481 domain-containing protein [Thermodesulfobacteriota bacterium]|nr:DUF481 domain-containing protein [Thermodesulfobacteriota bacterium]